MAGNPVALVVDDDSVICEWLKSCLAGVFEVHGTCDAETALEILRSRPVDLIVTDFCMPKMSGVELLIQARKIRAGIPVGVITSDPAEYERHRARLPHEAAFIACKPLKREEVLKLALAAVGRASN